MAKHKYIKTPEALWKLFEDYRKEVKSNPRIMYEFNGKDAVRCEVPLEVPLTLEGFYNYCRKNASEVSHYFKNSEDSYEEYRPICSHIKDEIRQDQIEGGMVGQFNPSITQRLNGLKEQQDIQHTGNVNILNIDPIDKEE